MPYFSRFSVQPLRLAVAGLVAAVVLVAAAPATAWAHGSVTIYDAAHIAERVIPGGTVVGAEREYEAVAGHGKTKRHVWEVDVQFGKTVWEVVVDARSGWVLGQHPDN